MKFAGCFLPFLMMLMIGGSAAQAELRVANPCEANESWEPSVKHPWLVDFQQYLKTKKEPFASLLQASKLKDDFGVYWKARVLMVLNQDLLSHFYFSELFRKATDTKLKTAALVCLTRLKQRMPSLDLPPADSWKTLYLNDTAALFTMLLNEVPHENEKFTVLRQPHSLFIRALYAHAKKKNTEEVRSLRDFISASSADPFLKRYQETAHLMLARALYSSGLYQESLAQYQLVEGTSNSQIDVLNESVWPMLQLHQHNKVYGLLQQLRTGALKAVFAPEPYLAAAMTALQLCLYPEATEIIQAYKTHYRPAFEWLGKHREDTNLYTQAVESMSGTSLTPQKISFEWIRSPTFLTRQQDLNFLARQETELKGWLKTRTVTTPLLHDLELIQVRQLASTREKIIRDINTDLKFKNRLLLTTLVQIRTALDNVDNQILIQATADQAWQSRNPQAKARVEKPRSIQTSTDWNWGRFPASESSTAELWEDEVGPTYEIRLEDRCRNKGRFLNLKLRKNN